ncbi:MAG: hypothetical protein ABIG39_00675 [Candidatus Micrarchaeota archaeon]
MTSEPSKALEKRWRAICKLILKEEVGDFSDYVPWLVERNEPIMHRKSSISGKETTYAMGEYAENSKWIDFSEVDLEKQFEPLSINEIKDIDSLVEALQDRFYYTGNIVLGNSKYIERSSDVSDSFYVFESARIGDSKYIGCCTMGRLVEDMYGCNAMGESAFCIKCPETYRDKRLFEVWMSQNCNDCYYSYGLNGCTECFFCFHLKSKRYAIGNLELEPSRYKEIKKKLLSEIVEELRRNKRVPSLIDIVAKSRIQKPKLPTIKKESPPTTSMKPIDDAFSRTCKLIFGRTIPGGVEVYSDWLTMHIQSMEGCSSVLSDEGFYRGDYGNYFDLPKDRLIGFREGSILGENAKLSKEEVGGLSFGNAHEFIGRIAFFSTEIYVEPNENTIDCPLTGYSSNSYRTFPLVYSKYCAYTFWPRSCEHLFGCRQMFDSAFCINCYYSVKLTRCFEMDGCRDCSDSYFCHNCENVRNSMFCFNTKNKRYAIGNVEVGMEEYMRIKKVLLGFVSKELNAKKSLGLGIFNLSGYEK